VFCVQPETWYGEDVDGALFRRRGEQLWLRSVFEDHVGAVVPSVVVADSAAETALFQPPGTTLLIRTGRRGGPNGRNMFPSGWDGGHAEVPWTGDGVLRVHRAGQPWSTWRWLDATGWRPGFYVNLERPWVRSAVGFDTTDWILDLLVNADGTTTWKDDDELRWAVGAGAVSQSHADTVRRAGDRALQAVQAGDWPFAADWDRWLPDPGWSMPALGPEARARVLRIG
jgi:hypothetical protein